VKIVLWLTALLLILLNAIPIPRLSLKRKLILKVPHRVFKPLGTVTTRILADYALKNIRAEDSKDVRILDVGCGSGAIGLLIARETKNYVIMTDIDMVAVKTAWDNALMNRIDSTVDVLRADLISTFREQSIDVVVSNPPFLPIKISSTYHVSIAAGEQCSLLLSLINQAARVCKRQGKVMFTISSLSDLRSIFIYAKSRGFDLRIRGSVRGLFDRIFIVELVRL